MRLPRTPAIFGLVGFVVPIASYLVWWLAYATGLGKTLILEFASRYFHLRDWRNSSRQGAVVPLCNFRLDILDVLWVAVINVPLYMALGLIWRAFTRHRKTEPKPF